MKPEVSAAVVRPARCFRAGRLLPIAVCMWSFAAACASVPAPPSSPHPAAGPPANQTAPQAAHVNASLEAYLAEQRRFRQLPIEQRRELTHEFLRKYREPHDTYLYLAEVADATTVPLLLYRLRQDVGGTEPPPPPPPPPPIPDTFSMPLGPVVRMHTTYLAAYSCVHLHLVDALADLTNTNQGMFYPAWKAWWDENQHRSRDEWIVRGFAAAGLHPSAPIDDRFGGELIEAMAGRPQHLASNARRLLEAAPAGDRLAWIRAAAKSPARLRRLGAAKTLDAIDRVGHEDLLRPLIGDADADVSEAALETLNERLRARSDRQATGQRLRRGIAGTISIRPIAVKGHVVADGASRIAMFDTRKGRRLWSNESHGIGEPHHLLFVGDRLIAASNAGGIAALDARGAVIWSKPAANEDEQDRRTTGRIFRVITTGGMVVVAREDRLEWIDPARGIVINTIAEPGLRDADAASANSANSANNANSGTGANRNTIYALSATSLFTIVDGRVVARRKQTPGSLAVSVGAAGVCVTRTGNYDLKTEPEVVCHDPATLAPRWSQRIGSNGTGGHRVAPLQSESAVYVPSDQRLSAFRASDGARLWSVPAGQETHGRLALTPQGLLTSSPNYRLELLNAASGELIAAWPSLDGIATVAASARRVAVAGHDGSVWDVTSRR